MRHRGIYASTKPVLGYWVIRGLASNIRYQLHYCGVDFDQKRYTDYQGWFKKDKLNLGLEFPNIPYFIHGENKLTETLAIHQYIAEVWDHTLLGKTAQDKAKVQMITCVVSEFRMSIVKLCYQQDDRNVAIEAYKKKLPEIIAYMGSNPFLIGDYPTFIDFYFFETVQLLAMISDGKVFEEFKPLAAYCAGFKQLKGVKDYFSDPFCEELPLCFNAPKMSKINGKLGFK